MSRGTRAESDEGSGDFKHAGKETVDAHVGGLSCAGTY